MSAGMITLGFFVGILILLILITLHEFGHFIIAKLSKAYVYEFAIGFGPRIFVFKGKETWLSIRAFPLGGYCSIASDKVDPPAEREDEIVPKERMMDYIARWKKLLFILFGPLMNLFIAIFLFTTIFAVTQVKPNDMSFYGATYNKDMIAYKLIDQKVNKHSEAKIEIDQSYVIWGWTLYSNTEILFDNICQQNNSECGPKINELDNKQAATYEKTVYNFLDHLQLGKDKENVSIKFAFRQVDRFTGKVIDQEVQITEQSTQADYKGGESIGIAAPTRYFANAGQAYLAGWKETFTQSLTIIKSFGMLFTGNITQLQGPVGVAGQTATMLANGQQFFMYVAMLSANLFILNMIFIPPLDGYKVLETIIEMIIRKELPQKYKIIVYSAGAILFLSLFVLITIFDFIL
ncbi:RIP metalloprotease RseP [Spiroplasma culicicola]|uniref:Zinc metalloprotease n=1 Tax=Spiroplasma culicicola AES-1 TaxID=1276246 RepID=W6A868_9MOLU|nr:RIP metalloprotease RseP [Spiroplasma culicicola]AHI53085.1 inner membrane zinc metalloprotease [Spiroplasma culicicola AES-1]